MPTWFLPRGHLLFYFEIMYRLKFKINPFAEPYLIGIYAIVCIPTGKMYIGQTRTAFLDRWLCHQFSLEHYRHNQYFTNAYKKYGAENFECRVLEYIDRYDETLFNRRETYWIKYYRQLNGYRSVFNMNDGGTGANPTPERRKQMSEYMKARCATPEHKKRQREVKEKLWADPERHVWWSKYIKEAYNSQEMRQMASERNKKRWSKMSEHKKMSEAQKESYISNPERKQKQSASQKRSWTDPEIRQKRIDSLKKAGKERIRNVHLLNSILLFYYHSHPEEKRLTIYGKLKLIKQLASEGTEWFIIK